MGMRMPEICWAVFKRQVINLRSCCILLVDSVESMMMHGLASSKFCWNVCNYLSVNTESCPSRPWVLSTTAMSTSSVALKGCCRWRVIKCKNSLCMLRWGHAVGGAVGWGTALQASRSRARFPIVSLEFFIDINLPTLGLAQPVTEMNTRNIYWG
jgi:hypothetical protein